MVVVSTVSSNYSLDATQVIFVDIPGQSKLNKQVWPQGDTGELTLPQGRN